ncbi:MAG: ATP-grasp domain-containing protein [Actinomycetota bacterium]|nr:ATP-grasp domain-containing protein [Actinomycetota bacterium]
MQAQTFVPAAAAMKVGRACGAAVPRVAVPYDAASFSPLQIAEAADGRCELVWVITRPLAELGSMGRLLTRLGRVVAVDGEDAEAAEAAASTLAEHAPVGIVTFSHDQLVFSAALAEQLGLAFNDRAAILNCVDKLAQRRAMAAAGLDMPAVFELTLDGRARPDLARLADFPFPAVLKPRAGHGSLETFFASDAKELIQLVEHGGADGAPVGAGEYVLEQFLDGTLGGYGAVCGQVADYVSVESAVFAGECRHLAVTGKFPLSEPFRETGNFMPSLLQGDARAEVEALATRALQALGVRFGIMHTEIKLTPAGPRVIEVNPRVGGGSISELFEFRTGRSLMHLALGIALGEAPAVAELVDAGIAYSLYLQPPPWARHLEALEGLTEVSAIPGVRQVALNRQPPHPVDWRSGSQGYVATVRGIAASHEQLLANRVAILERLRPLYA